MDMGKNYIRMGIIWINMRKIDMERMYFSIKIIINPLILYSHILS